MFDGTVIDATTTGIAENISNNYDTFFCFLFNTVIPKSFNGDSDLKIVLIPKLTVSQRHHIHRYTRGTDFYGITDHSGNVPKMSIFLSQRFYKEIADKYSIKVPEAPKPAVVDNFKKLAFEKHMQLLEELYPVEFANFFK
jgi:hypothetical protein